MSGQFLTRRHLSRRVVLRGAGAAIALPLLSSMLPAGRASAATPRARFACIYIPHGAVMRQWTPATDGAGFELPPILRSLEPFRDRLNVVSDLTLPLAYGDDASAGANHTRSSAVWLTCARPETGATPQLGTSIDQVAALAFGQDTPLPSLELSLEEGGLSGGSGLSGAYRNTIAWRTPTAPLPMEVNPQVVFERLFGDGATAEQRARRRTQAASLLDSVLEDAAALTRTLPGDDRARLERHLEDVREVERRIELAGSKVGGDLDVPVRPAGVPDDFEQHARLTFDLLALAWAADLTRVGTLMIAKEVSNAVYAASGISDPFHNLSHHSEVPANIERYARLNAYHTTHDARVFPRQAARHARRRRQPARSLARALRQRHEQLEPARPRAVADDCRGRRLGRARGRAPHPRGRRHAAGESAGRARAEARRRRRVVRRQHRRRFAVRRAWLRGRSARAAAVARRAPRATTRRLQTPR